LYKRKEEEKKPEDPADDDFRYIDIRVGKFIEVWKV
jgi:hypothetical protein